LIGEREEEDEVCGGDGGVEQDAEVSGGGGGQAVPPQTLQSIRQADLQVHGSRRKQPLQYRRSSQYPLTLLLTLLFSFFFLLLLL